MFVFANFVQKLGFEQSHLPKVDMALAKFYLFELSPLRVLEESWFKALKVPLD